MTHHHRVNLRAAYATTCGNVATQQAYEAEVEQARVKQAEQGIRHAVAPKQTLTLHDGRRLDAGAAITLEMFRKDDEVPAWRQLERLVNAGIVLEADVPGGASAAE